MSVPNRVLAALPALALFMLAPAGARGQATTLNFILTGTYQEQNSFSGEDTIMSTKTGRWTDTQLLTLLSHSLGISLPKGSYLAQSNGLVEIIIDKGLGTTNLSNYRSFNMSGSQVSSGSVSVDTGKENTASLIYATASFNDQKGNAFNVNGLLRETVALTAKDASGNQTESVTFSGNVAGYGTIVDNHGITNAAVFSGSITGAGKGLPGS